MKKAARNSLNNWLPTLRLCQEECDGGLAMPPRPRDPALFYCGFH